MQYRMSVVGIDQGVSNMYYNYNIEWDAGRRTRCGWMVEIWKREWGHGNAYPWLYHLVFDL
jgi:hypothetical protein